MQLRHWLRNPTHASYLDKTARSKTEKVREFVQTKPVKSAYRANIAENCWNFNIDSNELSGLWNGGPCTALGVGGAARLITFDAKRVTN
jgi:hypothetical protein